MQAMGRSYSETLPNKPEMGFQVYDRNNEKTLQSTDLTYMCAVDDISEEATTVQLQEEVIAADKE